MMKHLICVAFLTSAVSASMANASLIGTTVTGTLDFGTATNYFDSANGFVPASGYLNAASTTVPISQPQIEFGYQDGANQDTANFTNSQLFIEDQFFGSGSNSPFTMTFTDPSFAGLTITPTISDFPAALTASISGTTITITSPSQTFAADTSAVAVFNLTSTVTPEPASARWRWDSCRSSHFVAGRKTRSKDLDPISHRNEKTSPRRRGFSVEVSGGGGN